LKQLKRFFAFVLVLVTVLGMLPVAQAAIGDYTGNRDWLWPVPSSNTLSSCYMDLIGHGYGHYALDITGEHYADIIAPWDGTVIMVNNTCTEDYGKSTYCPCGGCKNLGKYAYIVHEYLGTTFVSRYGHMASIAVTNGAKVSKGDLVGKVGSTGRSFGYHLDFRIYQGSEVTSETATCVDPLMDQFLILPEGFSANHASSWSTCCYEYADDVIALYDKYRCKHPDMDGFGVCPNPECGFIFDWAVTRNTLCAGVYTVAPAEGLSLKADVPYSASENLVPTMLTPETEVEVLGSLTNAFGETWYHVAYQDQTGYAPADSLTFLRYNPQQIRCEDFSPANGLSIPKASYPLKGTVVSSYPLTVITAYLDGKQYASWTASNKTTTSVSLASTNINYALTFGGLDYGKHTIELKGTDIHRTEPETFHVSEFYTVKDSDLPTDDPVVDPTEPPTVCQHPNMDGFGVCPDCEFAFDWEATLDTGAFGIYSVTATQGLTLKADVPYAASEKELAGTVGYGQEAEVLASLTNAFGETWYQVRLDGQTGYAPGDSLVFQGYEIQQIVCTDFAPAHGITIPKASYPLKGTVTSKYPLQKIVAYLDGKEYASWTASNRTTTSLALSGTQINHALTFGKLSTGKHTIELKGMDIYRTEPETFHVSCFYTGSNNGESLFYTVLFNPNGGSCELTQVSVPENATITPLPSPVRAGYGFLGWYTAPTGGSVFTGATPVTENLTLYARWSRTLYPVPGGDLYFMKEIGMIIGADETVTAAHIPQSIGGTKVVGVISGAFQNCTKLTQVVFCGTEDQWKALSIGDNNAPLTSASLSYHDFQSGICSLCGAENAVRIRLTEDTRYDGYVLTGDLYLDLGGFRATGTIKTNGFAVYGMDSATDAYSCETMGSFSCVDENGTPIVPQRHFKDSSSKRYLTVETEDGYTFHRFYLGITHVSLAPSVTGFGYKAVFYGDDMVMAQLDGDAAFGFALQLEGRHSVTRFKTRDALASGEPVSLRLRDYDIENFGEAPLYARVMLTLSDGTVIESAQTATTMRTMLETLNDRYSTLSQGQREAIAAMIEAHACIRNWDVDHLCL